MAIHKAARDGESAGGGGALPLRHGVRLPQPAGDRPVPVIGSARRPGRCAARARRSRRSAATAAASPAITWSSRDDGDDFASSVGVGAVISTKFTWPKDTDNPVDKLPPGGYVLTPARKRCGASGSASTSSTCFRKGEYRGELYDIGFDKPEAHAIAKDGAMYYAFYAEQWNGKVQLRGLGAGTLPRARSVQRHRSRRRSMRARTRSRRASKNSCCCARRRIRDRTEADPVCARTQALAASGNCAVRCWRAAFTKPANSGCPSRGVEVNSGWNCVATNHG